ncbi:MAG TPA: hypothetical protein VNH11_01340 [Pirellulales bacterium]|nr:hypothetical protein [Pirellulales bacterium]
MLSAITSPIAIALLALIQVQETDDMFCLTSRAFGKTYKSRMAHDALLNSPTWDKEKADIPPVSPRKAIRLAEKMRNSVVKAPDDWEWHTVDLHLFLEGDHCVWHATFQAMPIEPAAGLVPRHEEVTLIVLMDGTVIEPVVSNDEDGDKKSQD